MRIIAKLKSLIIQSVDKTLSKSCTCSIGDLLLEHGEKHPFQFIVASRLLDIENFHNNGNTEFLYQNAVARILWGQRHDEDGGNQKFLDLINSYSEFGHKSSSILQVDRNYVLENGTHRVAACLYYGYYQVNIMRLPRKLGRIKHEYHWDWFLRNPVPTPIINAISERYDNIQCQLVATGDTFVCVVSNSVYNSQFIEDLGKLVTILKTSKYSLKKAGSSNKDIRKEEIPECGFLIQFSIKEPSYKIISCRLISERAIEIADVMKMRCKTFYSDIDFRMSSSCLEGASIYQLCEIQVP